MIKYIEFMDDKFNKEDNNNLLCDLTNNTIILCNNYNLMDKLANEICDTINGKKELNFYDCEDDDVGQAKIILQFGLQRIININGQRITLSLEPSIIYKSTSINDIWFYDWLGGIGSKYKESIYPMNIYKGSKEVYDSGLDEVYKMIVNSRYGCYDGKWVNNKENK